MSIPSVINWAASSENLATIASLQTNAVAGAMQLNTSTLPNNILAYPNNTNSNAPYVYDQVIRSVSLTSLNDNSGINFTIIGYGSAVDEKGNPTQLTNTLISEIIAGPDIDTVETTNIFGTILSITADGPINGVSAGFGTFGITNYLFTDYNRIAWYASCSAQVFNNNSLTYTTYISLNKPSYPGIQGNWLPFIGGEIPAFELIAAMTDAATNQIQPINFPISTIWFNVKANTFANADESVIFTFIQQGIT